jgi:hypothetical protein
MRKIAFALMTLGLVVTAAPSMAASLVFDTFTYPNGNLVPNGGWAQYSAGTANVDIQVASGRATGGAIGNPGNDDHILFTPQSVTAKTYACFDVLIPAVAGQPKPIYFAELKDGGAAALVSRVYVLPLASGGWTFGISHSSTSTTVGVTPWGAALSYDVNYHLVINYDPVAKSSTLWVNPVTEASTSVTDVNAAIPALAVSGFGLRQSNSASTLPASPAYVGTADWNFSVDNLGVGATFVDACEIPTPTQPTTWGAVKAVYR